MPAEGPAEESQRDPSRRGEQSRMVTAWSEEVGVVRPAAGEVRKSQDTQLSWGGIDTEEIPKCFLKTLTGAGVKF